jgi:hypothetical protein
MPLGIMEILKTGSAPGTSSAKDPQTKKKNQNGPKHNSPQGSHCFCCVVVILNQPPLPHDLVLDPQKPLCQGFRPGRTAGNINVHRNDLVYAFTNRVGELKESPTAGTAPHRDDILRIGHLIVEKLGSLGHFVSQCSGHDHQIRLPRRSARDCAKAIDIGPRTSRLHQFDGATGQAKQHVPLRRSAPPIKQIINFCRKNGFG